MHVAILTQYYAPEIGAPQRRLGHLARTLVARGHRVTVLSAMPSYPRGRIYPGYGGICRVEEHEGARVIRTFVFPSQSPHLLPRLCNYFSFVLSSILPGGLVLGRADYLITESPPLFLGIAGYLLSRWKKARWIFNVSDVWPESAVRMGVLKPGAMLSVGLRLESFCYRHAWLVTGQSQSIVENIRSRFPDVRTRLFSNGVDTREFVPCRDKLDKRGTVKAVYAGLHGLAQGLDQIVDAARLLADCPELQLYLIGEGPLKPALVQQARDARLGNVHFLDAIAAEQVPERLASADIAIVPLKLYIPGAVPSKLYEAMAAGVPVVLVGSGEPAGITREHEAGLVVSPGDIVGLAAALKRLATDHGLRLRLGANGRRAAGQYFERDVIDRQFVDLLERQLLDGDGRASPTP